MLTILAPRLMFYLCEVLNRGKSAREWVSVNQLT